MCSLVLPALLWIAAPLHAQGYVGGFVSDSITASPLPCVEVALLDTAGHVVSRQLTSGGGAFQLDAPPRGTYRLRFAIWAHEPLYGPMEELEPTMERGRKYVIGFRVAPGRDKGKRSPDDPTADAPPGLPINRESAPLRYPPDLREQGVQGDVTVDFVLDSTGHVIPFTLRVVKSTHPAFTMAARKFLELVQFQPARFDHHPACALMLDRPLTFRLGP
jgi:TonB family protein